MACRSQPSWRLLLSQTPRLPPPGLGAAAAGRRAAGCAAANGANCLKGTLARLFATAHAEQTVKTFANQDKLPRLPIPTLQETVDRHIKSLRPILPDNEFEQAGKAASQFVQPGGIGEVLQRRLLEQDALEPNNWLENIWLSKGYLEWREPSYIIVNWWGQFKDMPAMASTAHGAPTTGKASPLQVGRAAGLLSNLLNYNDMINRETLPPEYLGRKQQPLDMDQYRKQFGTSRIADIPADRISSQYPCLARHIVVVYKDQIFKVDVLGENGQRVPVASIESQLQKVVDTVERLSPADLQPPVGVLTTEHRDVWAKSREALLQKPFNVAMLKAIDTSIIALCLDCTPGGSSLDDFHPILHHNGNGRNRWYDKALQLIVATDGKAGFNGEHTPADAVVSGEIANYIVKNEPAQDPPDAVKDAILQPPRRLEWQMTPEVARAIQEAERSASKLASNIDTKLLHYNGYGSAALKHAKVSPDAYVQMALQLAYYRLFMVPCPTYETASTRAFRHGRTETVRVCSVDSVKFTESFDNGIVKKEERLALFQKAITSHLEYMQAASNGKGVDRHLLGLRTRIGSEDERALATLFTDASYAKAMYFKLSTSNMSPGTYLWGGFAPVVPEGFGVNYAIGKDMIKFSVATWKSSCEASSADFRESIRCALDDMARVFGAK